MKIVTHRKFRSGAGHETHYRRKRNWTPILIAHVKPADILRNRSIGAIGLEVNLPCSPEPIEIVDKRTAQENLGGLVNIRQTNSLLQDFILVHIEIILGNTR